MGLVFGDMTIREFEQRAGITLTKRQRETLNAMLEHECAQVAGNTTIHIFDNPFCIECGDMEARTTVLGILMPLSAQFKEPVQVWVAQQ